MTQSATYLPTEAAAGRRLLLVHAHPDDESIANGATMAKYVAEGADVTLVTCTGGEMGEILVPELEHLAAHRDDRLAEHRRTELADAMVHLGVTDHRYLGGFGRFRDSGMAWGEDGNATVDPNTGPDAFWNANLLTASNYLVEIIREIRPHALITYDEFGNYGHPDHIQAHRVAHYASDLAAIRTYRPDLGSAWDVPRIFWTAMSAQRFRTGLRQLAESEHGGDFDQMDPESLPAFAKEDDELDVVIDADDFVEAKLAAMKAHVTQIDVDGPFFALSNNLGNKVWAEEFYRLAKGTLPHDGLPHDGMARDLFIGL